MTSYMKSQQHGKGIALLITSVILTMAIMAGCADTSAPASKPPEAQASAQEQASSKPTPEPTSEPEPESSSETPTAYTDNGFTIVETTFDQGMGLLPESDMLFSINNIIDGTARLTSENEMVLPFLVKYTVTAAVTGTIKVVVTDPDGNTYSHEKTGAFANVGENSLMVLTKTKSEISGTYTLKWYIDDLLAYEATYTK